MNRILFLFALAFSFAAIPHSARQTAAKPTDWAFNATAIEACSCPMFCQCYFNTKPAAHHEHGGGKHFCRFNVGWKVNHGNFGDLKLDGVKFWWSGDDGADFDDGVLDWIVVTFDKNSTNAQREAIKTIVNYMIHPLRYESVEYGEGTIDKWEFNNDVAHATLDGGKTAEVKLVRFPGMTNEPIVIHNLKYWGAPRNTGFVLMPNEVQAYRVGPKAYEFKRTNGFMITIDLTSKDYEKAEVTGSTSSK